MSSLIRKFCCLFIMLASGTLFAGGEYYTDASNIDELYNYCVEVLTKKYNIHCIYGNDEVSRRQGILIQKREASPYSRFWDSANKSDVDRENEFDLNVLREMKISSEAPYTGDKWHYGFVTIYRNYYAYGKLPVVKVSASLSVVQKGVASASDYASDSVKKWFYNVVTELPVIPADSDAGKERSAEYERAFQELESKERAIINSNMEKTKPSCSSVLFSGVGATTIDELSLARKIGQANAVSDYPLVCEHLNYGGRYYNGAILNPKSRTTCRGVGLFSKQVGTIKSWTADAIYVLSDVRFDTGKFPVALWVSRSDFKCAP